MHEMPEPEPVPAVAVPAATAPPRPGDDLAAAQARQLSSIVEAERRGRTRTLLLWSTLLLPPVALALWVLLWPPGEGTNFNSPEFAERVTPIVRVKVGEQIKPAVEETLGPKVDDLLATRLEGKIQGASPARVEGLSKEVERVSAEMSQAQTGLREVRALRDELPKLREQVSANDASVRALQQRVERMANADGGDAAAAEAIKRLEARLASLDRRFEALSGSLEKNSNAIQALWARIEKLDRGAGERQERYPKKPGDRDRD